MRARFLEKTFWECFRRKSPEINDALTSRLFRACSSTLVAPPRAVRFAAPAGSAHRGAGAVVPVEGKHSRVRLRMVRRCREFRAGGDRGYARSTGDAGWIGRADTRRDRAGTRSRASFAGGSARPTVAGLSSTLAP